ncbi:MAG: hypothetical protein V1866_02025 [archaeon]
MNILAREHYMEFLPTGLFKDWGFGFDLVTNHDGVLEKVSGDLDMILSCNSQKHVLGLNVILKGAGRGFVGLLYHDKSDSRYASVVVDATTSNITTDYFVVKDSLTMKPNPGTESELVKVYEKIMLKNGGLLEYYVWGSINHVYQGIARMVAQHNGERFVVMPRLLECMCIASDLIYEQFVKLPNLEETVISPMPGPKTVAPAGPGHQ